MNYILAEQLMQDAIKASRPIASSVYAYGHWSGNWRRTIFGL